MKNKIKIYCNKMFKLEEMVQEKCEIQADTEES
jgi:hypothetical protein